MCFSGCLAFGFNLGRGTAFVNSTREGLSLMQNDGANLNPSVLDCADCLFGLHALNGGGIDDDNGRFLGCAGKPNGCADSIQVEGGRAARDQNQIGVESRF